MVHVMMAPRRHAGHTTLTLATITAVVVVGDYVEAMLLPAIPVIQTEFSTTAPVAAWITSILLILGTASTPLFGKLADIHGKKKVFLMALGVYSVGLALAGLSPSIYALLLARALQAPGLALGPLAFAMVTDLFPKERQAYAQGVIGGAVAVSTSAGLVLGSYTLQSLGWRDGFFTVLAASVVLFALGAAVLKESPVIGRKKVDYLGASTLCGGILLVLLYGTQGTSLGWFSMAALAFLVPGLVLTGGFIAVERNSPYPVIQLHLLRARNVLVANLVRIVGGVSTFLFFYAFVYYAEYPQPYGLGLDILHTGITLAPATLVVLVIAPLAGKLMPKVGPKPLMIVGALVTMAGFLMCIVRRSSAVDFALDTVVAYAGWGIVILPSVNMISVSLPKEQAAVGLGINSMLGTLGQSFGPVISTAVLASYAEPLIRVVNGHATVVGQVASSAAFDLIFGIATAVTFGIVVLGLLAKNYTFPGAIRPSKNAPR